MGWGHRGVEGRNRWVKSPQPGSGSSPNGCNGMVKEEKVTAPEKQKQLRGGGENGGLRKKAGNRSYTGKTFHPEERGQIDSLDHEMGEQM